MDIALQIVILLLAISRNAVLANTCFSDASLAGLLFGTCFATFLISFAIAMILWYFMRTRTTDRFNDAEAKSAESNNNENEQCNKNSYDNQGMDIETKDPESMDIIGVNKLSPIPPPDFSEKPAKPNNVQEQCTQSLDLLTFQNQYTQIPDSYVTQNEYTQLPDPFINTDDYFFQTMLKKITALGFNIQDENGNIYIGSVFSGSPAERSGNIFMGDKIKSVNISFEGMLIEDATAILGHASPYKVKLELERHLSEDATTTDNNISELSAESEDIEDSLHDEGSVKTEIDDFVSDSTLPASQISTALEPEINDSSTLTNSSESISIKQDALQAQEVVANECETATANNDLTSVDSSDTYKPNDLKSAPTSPTLSVKKVDISAASALASPTAVDAQELKSESSKILSFSPTSLAKKEESLLTSTTTSSIPSLTAAEQLAASTPVPPINTTQKNDNCPLPTSAPLTVPVQSNNSIKTSTSTTPTLQPSTPKISQRMTTIANHSPGTGIRRLQPSRIPKLNPEASITVKEIRCDGIFELVEVSKYNYVEPSASKKRNTSVEFCECMEPKQKSAAVADLEDKQMTNAEDSNANNENDEATSATKQTVNAQSPLQQRTDDKSESLRYSQNRSESQSKRQSPQQFSYEARKTDTEHRATPATPVIQRKIPSLAKTRSSIAKPETNTGENYGQQKDSARKQHSPQMRLNNNIINNNNNINKNITSLAEKRKARLEANETLLQKQQEELRALGVI